MMGFLEKKEERDLLRIAVLAKQFRPCSLVMADRSNLPNFLIMETGEAIGSFDPLKLGAISSGPGLAQKRNLFYS